MGRYTLSEVDGKMNEVATYVHEEAMKLHDILLAELPNHHMDDPAFQACMTAISRNVAHAKASRSLRWAIDEYHRKRKM